MLRVALTGGIATGKSYVRARIAARGIPTIDADQVVHSLFSGSGTVTEAIEARFGPSVLTSRGQVDRRMLGQIVFNDLAARRDLEAIVHPAVFAEVKAWMEEMGRRRPAPGWVLADIPLLFETGRQQLFDVVLVTACAPEVQRARVMARDGVSEADAERRLAAQWPIARKRRLADRVIDTGGSFEDTDRQVDEACAWLDRLVRP